MAKIEWDKDFITDENEFITTYQETGVIGFDLAISNGRGLPVGGCILMYSAPGSGKSTLLNLMAGIEKLTKGEIICQRSKKFQFCVKREL